MTNLWSDKLQNLSREQIQALHQRLLPYFKQLLEREKIPAETEIVSRFADLYLPLSGWLAAKHADQPIVVGINGAQGSGKSTLTQILAMALKKGFAKKVVSLSIDDLYKTRQQRQHMADMIHPLFITRGVPGTHDIELGQQLFADLKNNKIDKAIQIPGFNKALDDRQNKEDWKVAQTPVDIILFEGWCVGAIAEQEEALTKAINPLEETEDQDRIWRQYVNDQLTGPYQQFFTHIDILIMLEIPDMKHIYQWRSLQEQKLKVMQSVEAAENDNHIISNEQLKRFIMHFERITRSTLAEMPHRADIVLKLNENHQIDKVTARPQ